MGSFFSNDDSDTPNGFISNKKFNDITYLSKRKTTNSYGHPQI